MRDAQELKDEDDQEAENAQPQKSAFDLERFVPDELEDDAEDEEAWGDEDEHEIEGDQPEIAPQDLAMFDRFHRAEEDPLLQHGWGGQNEPKEVQQGANLADIIMAKIAAFEESGGAQEEMGGVEDVSEEELPPKVIEVYTKYVRFYFYIRLSLLTEL